MATRSEMVRLHRCECGHRHPKGPNQFSKREAEVLGLIAHGYPQKEAAASLGIKTATLKSHLTNIMGKMGVNNAVAAATVAAKEGLIEIDVEAMRPYEP